MLSTAITRQIQSSALRSSLLASSATIWSRSMAKNHKPNNNHNQSQGQNHNSNNPTQRKSADQPNRPNIPKPIEESSKAPKQPQPGSRPVPGNTEPHSTSENSPDGLFADAKSNETEATKKDTPPSRPLPDLRQGIPSTLEFEAAGASPLSAVDLTEAEESSGGRGKGELPASAYISSSDKKRARNFNIMYILAAGMSVGGVIYLGRNWDNEEEEKEHPDAPSGWDLRLMYKRASARLESQTKYYTAPAFQKLLPDHDPMYEHKKYTLVLSLEDLLIHNEWSRQHGWRMAKRPGVDYFIRYLSHYYEIVLFTSLPSAMAEIVVQKLDPFGIMGYRLFREGTDYKNGEYIKDLSYLNRPLGKIVMIDTVPAHASRQPENAIILPKWTGNKDDRDLVSLIPFLEFLANPFLKLPDVRPAITSYNGKHIPTEFARREALQRKEFEALVAEENKKRPKKSALGMFTNTLGIKSDFMQMPEEITAAEVAQGMRQGKMVQDIAREKAMAQYVILEREIRENGPKWLEEDKKNQEMAQKEGLKMMKSGFTGWFGVGPPPEDGK